MWHAHEHRVTDATLTGACDASAVMGLIEVPMSWQNAAGCCADKLHHVRHHHHTRLECARDCRSLLLCDLLSSAVVSPAPGLRVQQQ